MNKLDKYLQIYSQIKELEEQLNALKPEVATELKTVDGQKVDLDGKTVSLSQRTSIKILDEKQLATTLKKHNLYDEFSKVSITSDKLTKAITTEKLTGDVLSEVEKLISAESTDVITVKIQKEEKK